MKNNICTKQVQKIVMVCIDGLSWDFLTRFCEAEFLPNFSHLIRKGASGVLRSTMPLLSPRIWASIYTGKSPEKHGIEDFYTHTIKTKQIWEILHENGEKIGIFNPLTAFEPLQVDGFFVPGFITPTISTCPPDLEFLKEISAIARDKKKARLVKYGFKLLMHGCRISTLSKMALVYFRLFITPKSESFGILHKIKAIESLLYSDVFIYCLKKYAPTFSVFYDNSVDFASHWYWKYLEPESFEDVNKASLMKYKNTIKDYYVRMDEILGRIMSTIDKDTTIIVVSDHGFKAMSTQESSRHEILVNSILRLMNLEDKLYGTKVGKVGFLITKNDGINIQQIEDMLGKVKFKEYDEYVFRIIRMNARTLQVKFNMESLKDQDQSILLPNSTQCRLGEVVNFIPEISGEHSSNGVIVVSGPGIVKAGKIDGATVFDVAPTVLALKGMPIPDDMDGKVLIEAFNNPIDEKSFKHVPTYDSSLSGPPTKGKLSEEEETHIKVRLKELGYL